VRKEELPPGDVGEVDFGTLGLWWDAVEKRKRKLNALVMVLGYSRHMFVWVTPTIDQRAWVQGHCEAFAFFGGVPARVVLDNMKDGVLKADIYDPKFNRTYEEMARHYGFLVDPARARKPRDKPRVERMIPYVRSSFWKGRSFDSIPQISATAGCGAWKWQESAPTALPAFSQWRTLPWSNCRRCSPYLASRSSWPPGRRPRWGRIVTSR